MSMPMILTIVLAAVFLTAQGQEALGSSGGVKKRLQSRQHIDSADWVSASEGTEKEFVDAMNLAEVAVHQQMQELYDQLLLTLKLESLEY